MAARPTSTNEASSGAGGAGGASGPGVFFAAALLRLPLDGGTWSLRCWPSGERRLARAVSADACRQQGGPGPAGTCRAARGWCSGRLGISRAWLACQRRGLGGSDRQGRAGDTDHRTAVKGLSSRCTVCLGALAADMAVGGQEIGRGALCNITPPQLHITCVQGALVGRCLRPLPLAGRAKLSLQSCGWTRAPCTDRQPLLLRRTARNTETALQDRTAEPRPASSSPSSSSSSSSSSGRNNVFTAVRQRLSARRRRARMTHAAGRLGLWQGSAIISRLQVSVASLLRRRSC